MQLEKSSHGCLQQNLKAFKKSLLDQIQDTLNHSGKQLQKITTTSTTKKKKHTQKKKWKTHPITYQDNCEWKANFIRNYTIMACGCGAFLSLNRSIN